MNRERRRRDLHRTLVAHGFSADRSVTAQIRYTGVLSAADREISVSISFDDLEFITLPVVTLLNPETEAPNVVAHLTASGQLCFARESDVVLDRYNVGGTILLCLALAQRGLERALTHKKLESEIADEFPQHWLGQPFLHDLSHKKSSARFCVVRRNDRPVTRLLFDNENALRRIVGSKHDFDGSLGTAEPAIVYHPEEDLTFHRNFSRPDTLAEFLDWMESVLPGEGDGLVSALAGTHPKDPPHVFLAAPNGCVGISIQNPRRVLQAAQRTVGRERLLSRNKKQILIDRFYGKRFDLPFILERNMNDQSPLLDKRIALIGCGTIGSHLAKFLVQSGAAHGEKGLLLFIDDQPLEAGNVGRHYLGINCVGESKAKGLKHELSCAYSDAQMRAVSSGAVDYLENLVDFDLVIDATGEEALSVSINDFFVRHRQAGSASDVLHVWLYGNGVAAQTLLVDSGDYACFKCLKPDPRGEWRFTPLKSGIAAEHVAAACGEAPYVPYGVASPVMAAALALQASLDWGKADPSPRLRTIRVEKKDTRERADKNPEKTLACVACSPQITA